MCAFLEKRIPEVFGGHNLPGLTSIERAHRIDIATNETGDPSAV